MLASRNLATFAAAAFTITLFACSSSTKTSNPSDAGTADSGAAAARPKSKPKTASLKAKGGAMPPTGATSTGAQTQPKAGAVTVPISNVEVFTYTDAFSDDSAAQPFLWAYVPDTGTYLWTSGAVTCADGSVDSAGAFLMEVLPDGTGTYLFSLAGCPTGDLFGCDFDASGNETTCGVCQVQDGALVCAVSP